MTDYPTPPRTVSPATSISSSPRPATPLHGLGLSSCPFSSILIEALTTPVLPSYQPTTAGADWCMPVPMCGNPLDETFGFDQLLPASYTFPDIPLGAGTLYNSPPLLPSSSLPVASANSGAGFAQPQGSIAYPSSFLENSTFVKHEEDGQSWFDGDVEMEGSQSSRGFPFREDHNIRFSPMGTTNDGSQASPRHGFNVLSKGSRSQSQPFEPLPSSLSNYDVEAQTVLSQPDTSRTVTGANRRYQCTFCPRAFDKKYNLKEHEKKHDPKRVSQHLCPKPGCGKRLGRPTDVARHVQSVHEKAKKFACSKCLRRFDRKDTLGRHCERDGACPYAKQYGEMHFTEPPRLAASEYPAQTLAPDVQMTPFSSQNPGNYFPPTTAYPSC